MVRLCRRSCPVAWSLSVLALSSRFDGRGAGTAVGGGLVFFQYSLCRVVLMVVSILSVDHPTQLFQYSLCRVVLMVPCCYGAGI